MKSLSQSDEKIIALFEDYVGEWIRSTFSHLTPPQREAWPLIAENKNTLIFSPTGSGKTLAAFLFCINELFNRSVSNQLEDAIYILYISPLRALGNDIHRNLYNPLRGIQKVLKTRAIQCQPIRARVRTGDTPAKDRARMARNPPHILITTPETLYIILTTKKFRENLKSITHVIVDEIHALAGSKRGVQLSVSLERLSSLLGRDPVRIGLSATQSPVEEIAKFLVGMKADGTPRDYSIVDIGARKHLDLQVISPVDNLLEAKPDVVWNAAYRKLIEMIQDHETTLIFTNSRYRTEHMTLQLKELGDEQGLQIGSHHGSMSRLIRQNTEEKLKNNLLDAVVATSSLELGIDIGSINLVCNVESPKSLSSGMQRIGRAGHLLKETSKGRIITTDPNDLVESAALVRGIMGGKIDTTHIPFNALDILAQQIVACAAADEWDAEELFDMIQRSYCYHALDREDFNQTIEMLSSQLSRHVYPKIFYDKINNKIRGSRGARTIAFRCGGAIPDVSHYDVYHNSSKIGTLDEGFVERIRPGDVFILGSQAWRMTDMDKKKVMVRGASGVPPTIPYWEGLRPSRTYDLGHLVGALRREAEPFLEKDLEAWLQKEYLLDPDGANAIARYFKEEYLLLDLLPTDRTLVVETFNNELGQQQIIIHSPFGSRINETWGHALIFALHHDHNITALSAANDDGVLIALPEGIEMDVPTLFQQVTPQFIQSHVQDIIMSSPVFTSRFRHCAVRSFLILKEYSGKRIPVWLQSLKAADLMEELQLKRKKNFPVTKEALRESAEEAFDVPHLLSILTRIQTNEISVFYRNTNVPSPFIHQLLLVGQFGDFGHLSNEERRLRLIHLHRQVLKQLVDEDVIQELLVEEDVQALEKELQYLLPHQKARSPDELMRILNSLGDLTTTELKERMARPEALNSYLEALCAEKRMIQISIPFASPEERWISSESFSVYRAAFARTHTGAVHEETSSEVTDTVLRHMFKQGSIIQDGKITPVKDDWIPPFILSSVDSHDAQVSIVKTYLNHHGPVTKYELMERYGGSSPSLTALLQKIKEEGLVEEGSFIGFKDTPQWCWKRNLEELHRRSLESLKEYVKPQPLHRYADFMVRWQHVHPDTQLKGKEGVYEAIEQLQTWEEYITSWERYLLASRVSNYSPSFLDELIEKGRISFGRFNPLPPHESHVLPSRGHIQLYCTKHTDTVVPNAIQEAYYEDLRKECGEIMETLKIWPALSLEGITTGTHLDTHRICRAVLRLFQLGVVTNNSYDTVRDCTTISGLSPAWDISSTPEEVSDEQICANMENKGLAPGKGKWLLVKRPSVQQPLLEKVRQLFRRYGIITRSLIKNSRESVTLDEFLEASRVLLLRGEIREGRFFEGLGIQYATAEAVEFLRDIEENDRFVVLNMRDPASLYGKLLTITDTDGSPVKHAVAISKHIALQRGVVVALLTTKNYPERSVNLEINLLRDFELHELVDMLVCVIMYAKQNSVQSRFGQVRVVSFNEQPVSEENIGLILEALGFKKERNIYKLNIRRALKDFDTESLPIPSFFSAFSQGEAPHASSRVEETTAENSYSE
jgi:ATP-dependent Lhr-like helicase